MKSMEMEGETQEHVKQSLDVIKNGMSVMIRRGDQERTIEFNSSETISFGKGSALQVVELTNALGKPNFSNFRVKLKEKGSTGQGGGNKYYLDLIEDNNTVGNLANGSGVQKGKDNRDIFDDNTAQKLKASDIQEMREQGASGDQILESLISNSASFNKKTEYAQEKYVRKKEKMYGDSLTIERLTLPTLAEYYFKRDSSKVLGIRSDTLSQMLSYANIHAGGKFIVYETGCSGLVVAAVLQRLGGVKGSLLLHVHAGSTPQRQAVNLLNLTEESLQPLRSLDVFYLVNFELESSNRSVDKPITDNQEGAKDEPSKKRSKNSEESGETPDEMTFVSAKALPTVNRAENEMSRQILDSTQFDGLVIAGKEHPLSILQRLLPHVAPAAPLVIYSQIVEPLGDCYFWLKDKNLAVNIHVIENWCRNIQVDTERTHPEINMSATSGYLLLATAVDKT